MYILMYVYELRDIFLQMYVHKIQSEVHDLFIFIGLVFLRYGSFVGKLAF